MGATLTVSVPGGQWVDGVRYRDVELRPLPARDEILLADPDASPGGDSAASRLTWLLARCVARLGPLSPVEKESVRDLTVGDREALALHLRRLLVGERMACVVTCPDCRETLELDLSVEQLLVPPYADAGPPHETTADGGGVSYRVLFRLPTGRDQEVAGSVAVDGHGVATDGPAMVAAADTILRRCILAISRADEPAVADLPTEGGDEPSVVDIPAAVAAHLPGVMAELDPQALLHLDMRCPSCGKDFVVPFSPSAFLVRELIDRSRRLIGEVHALAMSYHWSESAILGLPARRRHAYLDMLDRARPVEVFS